MTGREKCDYLKKYRESIAKNYGFKRFEYKKCNTRGYCYGTCQYCDIQTRKLNAFIKMKGLSVIKVPLNIEDCNDTFTPFDLSTVEITKQEGLKGHIFGINRLCLNGDGEGITTLVGMFGCNLNCKYCPNSNSLSDNLEVYNLSVSDLFDIVKVDDLYFKHSDGGICFGGHEPLFQVEFIKAFIKYVRDKGYTWKFGIETALNVELSEEIRELLGELDFIIVDIKSMDSSIYKDYTGVDNQLVKDNLMYLVENKSCKLTVKVPKIPDYTAQEDMDVSVKMLEELGVKSEEISIIDYTDDINYIMSINDYKLENTREPDMATLLEEFDRVSKEEWPEDNIRLEGFIVPPDWQRWS